jgi:hypothetical protein
MEKITMSGVNPSYEEFMTACKADGTPQEVCDARWKAANEVDPVVPAATPSPGDTDLYRKIEMLQSQLKVREDQLRQAIGIANRANDERKAREHAEVARLIDSIQLDSQFTKEDLANKSLSDLQTMRMTLDKSIEQTFASVAAEMDAARRKRDPFLTAGAWDRDKNAWVGGI